MNDATQTQQFQEVNGNIVRPVEIALPVSLQKRTEIATSLGFKEIKEVRDALLSKDPIRVEAAKKYGQAVKDAKPKINVELTYPAVSSLTAEQLQDFIYAKAYEHAYSTNVIANRKGEELQTSIFASYFDLLGESTEEEGEYDADSVLPALEAFVKAKGYNDVTISLVATAVKGTKAQMLQVRKFFDKLATAQTAFASWCAETEGVDMDAVSFWLKRQVKRLAAARATPEINEAQIDI